MKNAFIDPVTNVLKAVGFVDSNRPGDIKIKVSDDFNLEPETVEWNGVKFIPYTKPYNYKVERQKEYIAGLGEGLPDVVDAIIEYLEGDSTAFNLMAAKINAIKLAHPKP